MEESSRYVGRFRVGFDRWRYKDVLDVSVFIWKMGRIIRVFFCMGINKSFWR